MNSAGQTTVPSLPGGPAGAAGARLRTVALGLEVWLLCVGLPFVEHGGSIGAVIGLASPLVLLLLGEILRARAPRWARGILAAGVPVSLAAGASLADAGAVHDVWGGVLGPLVAISLVLYLVVVLHSFARPAPTRATGYQPLPDGGGRVAGSRVLSNLSFAIVAVGAFVATAVLPFAIARPVLLARFPDAADDARTLAVAVGGGLFSIALGAIVGPGLRARRAGDAGRERIGASVSLSLAIAVIFGVLYLWLTFGR